LKDRQTILILDDEEFIIQSLAKVLQRSGYGVLACLHPREAFNCLKKHEVDLIISDLKMSSESGLDFLAQARLLRPEAAAILLVDPEERESAAEAMSRGIADWFMEKPWDEKIIRITIPLVLRVRKIAGENRALQNLLNRYELLNEESALDLKGLARDLG
jgi:DNA-binding NtrC family response regulator